MNHKVKNIVVLWCAALVLFLLRFMEILSGFDPATGLTVPVAVRDALVAGVVLSGLGTTILCRRLPKDMPSFSDYFSSPEQSKVLLVLGSFLMMGGGVWLGIQTLSDQKGIASLVTAGLAAVAGAGFLVLTKKMCSGDADSVTPLLPVLFFSSFLVLSLYLPAGSDPVLARYGLPILAAAMSAYAFAQLAGFFRRETKIRTFHIVARIAVLLCTAACAEFELVYAPLYFSCAMILSVFLVLAKE